MENSDISYIKNEQNSGVIFKQEIKNLLLNHIENALNNNKLFCLNCYENSLKIVNDFSCSSIDAIIQCNNCKGIWNASKVINSQDFIYQKLKEIDGKTNGK